jgi:hypothetical protein
LRKTVLARSLFTLKVRTFRLVEIFAPGLNSIRWLYAWWFARHLATAATQQTAVPTQTNGGDRPSVIIVEVLGYGGGDGDAPSRQDDDQRRKKDHQSYDPAGSVQYVGVGLLTSEQKRKLTLEEQSRLSVEWTQPAESACILGILEFITGEAGS